MAKSRKRSGSQHPAFQALGPAPGAAHAGATLNQTFEVADPVPTAGTLRSGASARSVNADLPRGSHPANLSNFEPGRSFATED
jgi:hypothetical protein